MGKKINKSESVNEIDRTNRYVVIEGKIKSITAFSLVSIFI